MEKKSSTFNPQRLEEKRAQEQRRTKDPLGVVKMFVCMLHRGRGGGGGTGNGMAMAWSGKGFQTANKAIFQILAIQKNVLNSVQSA